jgi:cobalamin-dependent methionine synthase I
MTAAPARPFPARPFHVIGENLHATRVLRRDGPRIATLADGSAAIAFAGAAGETLHLPVPDAVRRGADWEEGRVKHVKIALLAAMGGDPGAARLGEAYLSRAILAQAEAGAHAIDVNVDEVSIRPAAQRAAMTWLAGFASRVTRLPLAIDSSDTETIAAGLAALPPGGPRPILNSASLERRDALAVARRHEAQVVVTAAGEKGMPAGPEERVANASRMIEAALAEGLAAADILVDPLIFPVSVDAAFAGHALDAMRGLRSRWGGEIRITGGFSNVSFGIPARRAINDAFLAMAMAAGADSAILDPVQNPPSRALALDSDDVAARLARDVLEGRDENCRAYLRAWRRKEI